ncbi:DinB family protein [Fulvivirga ulvae]|uniref:DinB family protein n=1 Tax=Fulvivirga ulvae TaxID=2904245 RepID=UPI001F3B48D4|nr:DinB family protein [Fulvivirga ulvae]UII31162.1 DinB family protein [Fulvivirga ulvae]
MTKYLALLEKRRTMLLKNTEHLTTDQYNLVPPGFNNNIIWNMGHTLIISESLLYGSTPFKIPRHEFEIEGFKKGTKPELAIDDYGISLIRKSLSDTVPALRKLLNDAEVTSSQISKSDPLHPLISDKSLDFMLFHEDMHFAKIQQLLPYVLK